MMQRRGFYSRGPGNYRWKAARPYHVALEDGYIRAHWHVITELCKDAGHPGSEPSRPRSRAHPSPRTNRRAAGPRSRAVESGDNWPSLIRTKLEHKSIMK
jgi:hypothetical protein